MKQIEMNVANMQKLVMDMKVGEYGYIAWTTHSSLKNDSLGMVVGNRIERKK